MDISKLISRLDINQRMALKHIFDKLQAGKSLSGKDVGLLGFKIEHCQQIFILEVFDITKPTIAKWVEDGCPRNEDGSYNIKLVAEWRVKYEKTKYINKNDPDEKYLQEIEKIKLQRKKLEMDIETAKKNTIPVQEHREFLAARAADLKDYLMGYAKMNLNEIAGQPIEVCQKYWDKVIRAAMNTYVKNRI